MNNSRRAHLLSLFIAVSAAGLQEIYLYWIVSDVVEARSLVIRILTMLKRKMKLICGEIKMQLSEYQVEI